MKFLGVQPFCALVLLLSATMCAADDKSRTVAEAEQLGIQFSRQLVQFNLVASTPNLDERVRLQKLEKLAAEMDTTVSKAFLIARQIEIPTTEIAAAWIPSVAATGLGYAMYQVMASSPTERVLALTTIGGGTVEFGLLCAIVITAVEKTKFSLSALESFKNWAARNDALNAFLAPSFALDRKDLGVFKTPHFFGKKDWPMQALARAQQRLECQRILTSDSNENPMLTPIDERAAGGQGVPQIPGKISE